MAVQVNFDSIQAGVAYYKQVIEYTYTDHARKLKTDNELAKMREQCEDVIWLMRRFNTIEELNRFLRS